MDSPDKPLIKALQNSMKMHKAQLHGKRVWLACSGGRDSLSLAILCRQLFDAKRLPFLPQLLHVNHGMQEANTAWSQQVMAWAQTQDMPCQVLTLDLEDNSEQGARNARYQAMMQVMNTGDVLMLGHHQDDQVETVLMRLFSGAGVTGLGGMQAWSAKWGKSDQDDKTTQIYLWRPWLTISRAQITAYAQSQRLDYIDDPTNMMVIRGHDQAEVVHKLNDRAWLRSVLMPCLLQRYPKAGEAIARSSQLMQSADSIIQNQAQRDLAAVVVNNSKTDNWQSVLDIDRLQQLSSARQSALIHAWLAPTPEDFSPPKRLVDAVLDLAKRQNPDHQTCLYWDSSGEQYQIRRYQQHLYRLSLAWDAWLGIEPITQQLRVERLAVDNSMGEEGGSNSDATLELDKKLDYQQNISLKQQGVDFEWRLYGLLQLKALISDQLPGLFANVDNNANTGTIATESNAYSKAYLLFQPLPRQLKLALACRVGRKAGKKLLQAIGQPSFMRRSVVLCSLSFADSQPVMALLIITTDKVVVLESPLANQLQMMVVNQQLYSQVRAQI